MIEFEIPGETGKDNCVAACVSTGRENHRLLLDCGGDCLWRLPRAQLLATRAFFCTFTSIITRILMSSCVPCGVAGAR